LPRSAPYVSLLSFEQHLGRDCIGRHQLVHRSRGEQWEAGAMRPLEAESVQLSRSLGAVLVEVQLLHEPPWEAGPFPFSGGGVVASREARGSYFHGRSADVLYGTVDHPSRWYRNGADGEEIAGCTLVALEIVAFPDLIDADRGILVAHVYLHDDPIRALQALSDLRPANDLHGASPARVDLSRAVAGIAQLGDGRPVTMAMVTFPDGPDARPQSDYNLSPLDSWCWMLASKQSPSDFRPDPEDRRISEARIFLSSSWRAMVLRDGVAFVGAVADGHEHFFEFAELYVRSIYLDGIVLGLLQRSFLHSLADDLAGASSANLSQLRVIERRLNAFRTLLWSRHVTLHGPANDLLIAFQNQHGLPQVFSQLVDEINNSVSLAALSASSRTERTLNTLTFVGLPLLFIITAAPIWIDHSPAEAIVASAVAFAVAFGLLAATAALRRL
jgi:hypothetical protein